MTIEHDMNTPVRMPKHFHLVLALLVACIVLALCIPAFAQVTPRTCITTTVATGGTAVQVLTGNYNGFYIQNPVGATESLFVDPVGTANTTGTGTTTSLAAGQFYQGPLNGAGAVTVNAATTSHAFACVRW